MKPFAKKIAVAYLNALALRYLAAVKPAVIVLIGSRARGLVRYRLERRLEGIMPIRSNPKGYTGPVGIPLSILGLRAGFSSPMKWLSLVWEARRRAHSGMPSTDCIVLEIAIDTPADASAVSLCPDIALITDAPGADARRTGINDFLSACPHATVIAPLDGNIQSLNRLTYATNPGADVEIRVGREGTSGTEVTISWAGNEKCISVGAFGSEQVRAAALAEVCANLITRR